MPHGTTLNWVASVDPVAGYNVLRGTTPGGESSTPINSALITGTTYEDASVVAGTTYYYTVVGVSASGAQTPPSNEAHDTIPFAAPTGLTAVGN